MWFGSGGVFVVWFQAYIRYGMPRQIWKKISRERTTVQLCSCWLFGKIWHLISVGGRNLKKEEKEKEKEKEGKRKKRN